MVPALFARLRSLFRQGERKDHVSILVPFLIISASLGVVAWRSYQLSLRMESGAKTIAMQYARYAAEITARRVDAAASQEMAQAAEDWQHLDRQLPEPTFSALREWINTHHWIVSAIYVPDLDPASSIFVSELAPKPSGSSQRLSQEFYTSGGSLRYTYDPALLIARVQGEMRQKPLTSGVGAQEAEIALIPARSAKAGELALPNGFSFVETLRAPLNSYAVRAAVRTSYLGTGWENQRVVSLLVSLFALVLMFVGSLLALRGMRKEAETMKLRGALIANVSHELRTPLSMIRLGAETLKRGSKLKEKERQEIEDQILREVLHLSHMVENVLDVARIQHRNAKALAFTPVYPSDLVEELINTYHSWIESKGFEVTLDVDDSIEEQMWDREAVSRALLNLVDNAIKYSADDKRIDVILREAESFVVLEVRDHGIGIAQKELARIFDPYYRATFSDTQTRRGAGLGLTLVEQIVQSHGGRIEVESEPGAGSTFRLIFPLASADEAERVGSVIQTREAF
ncbi:MAG TPA: HAMP domain-containing sensor histidine kinase [Thermoanaerobaculia bacterium]|jgi:signal transduction histidine kinase